MPHLKCDCTSCTALKTAPVDLSPVMECWHTDFIGSAEEDEIVAKAFPNVTYPSDAANKPELLEFLENLELTPDDMVNEGLEPECRLDSLDVKAMNSIINNYRSRYEMTDDSIPRRSEEDIRRYIQIKLNRDYDELLLEYQESGLSTRKSSKLAALTETQQLCIYATYMGVRSRYIAGTKDRILKHLEITMICMLHLEMRIGEKLITLLLQRADSKELVKNITDMIDASLDKSNISFVDEAGQKTKAIFIVEQLSDKFEILFTLDKDIRGFKTSCKRQKKIMMLIPRIIDMIFGIQPTAQKDIHERALWIDIFARFRTMIDDLNRKEDFSNEMIDDVQLQMDQFCIRFVGMFTRARITNYIHDLESGHVKRCLVKYRNLGRNANIGLEGYIRVMKAHINKRTKCGKKAALYAGKHVLRRAYYNAMEQNKNLVSQLNAVANDNHV